jgi:hypothetical protein
MDDLQIRLDALEQRTHTVARQLRWWRGTALLLLMLGFVSLPWQMAHTQEDGNAQVPEEVVDADLEEERAAQAQEDLDAQALTLEQRVAALEAKLKYLSTFLDPSGRPTMRISGANLRVVNGLGKTQTVNGLGNLFVGYNENRSEGGNVRTGSHNLVVGQEHNFSRFGGIVVGQRNTISGNFAAVSGGHGNSASGSWSSVSAGGFNPFGPPNGEGPGNRASGTLSSVSGGRDNEASGELAVVSGGLENLATGAFSTVSGGLLNRASGGFSAVSGGVENSASGVYSTVSGGLAGTAPGESDWVAGGLFQDQ